MLLLCGKLSKCYVSTLSTRSYDWLKKNPKILPESRAGLERDTQELTTCSHYMLLSRNFLVNPLMAYESVQHEPLLRPLVKSDVLQTLCKRAVMAMYDSPKACILIKKEKKPTESIHCLRGLNSSIIDHQEVI